MNQLEVPYDIAQKYQIKQTTGDFRELVLHSDPVVDKVFRIYQR